MAPHVGRARGSTVECLEGACFGGGSAVDWLLWQRGREGEKTGRGRPKNAKTAQNAPCGHSIQVGYSDSGIDTPSWRHWLASVIKVAAC